MRRRDLLLLGVAFIGLTGLAQAADKNDPTGTWKWTQQGRGDQKREVTLKLKLEGDKLTGSMPGRNNNETQIENGKFKDGELSFTVTREFNGQKFVAKYKGKVDGDTIKGTRESERDGKTRSTEWEAKREKDKA